MPSEETAEKKAVAKTSEEKAASEQKTEKKTVQLDEPDEKDAAEKAPEQNTAGPASDKKTPAAGENVSGADAAYTEAFEKGKIAGLQEAILAIMGKNGPITDQMRKDVMDNVYHDSLINWIKSFR